MKEGFSSKDFLLECYPTLYGHINLESFNRDYRGFKSIRTMLAKDNHNYKLMVNTLVKLHNVFGENLLKVIPYEFINAGDRIKVNTMLVYLGYDKNRLTIDKNFLRELSIGLKAW